MSAYYWKKMAEQRARKIDGLTRVLDGKFLVGFYRYDVSVMEALGKELPTEEFKATAWIIEDGRPRRLGCAFGASKGDAFRGLEPILLGVSR